MLLIFAVAFVAITYAENCDKLGILVYEDMGCTPTYAKGGSCPSKYSCVGLKKDDKHCYFKGKVIEFTQFANESIAPRCMFGCQCHSSGDSASFNCPQVSCDPFLYNYKPTKPGCYLEGSLDQCCHLKEICPPYDDESIKCVVDGVTYRENQDFYPNNSCWNCLCKKGWTGKFEEPFCQRRKCGVQLQDQEKTQKSCAPVYTKTYDQDDDVFCCPSFFTCPEGSETIKGKAKSNETCKYGDMTLKLGQYIEKVAKRHRHDIVPAKVKCTCTIPPLLTCTEI